MSMQQQRQINELIDRIEALTKRIEKLEQKKKPGRPKKEETA